VRPSPRGFSFSNREEENFEGPENLPLPDRSEASPLVSFFRSRKDFSAPVRLPNNVFLFPVGFPVRAIISVFSEDNGMDGDKKVVLTVPPGRPKELSILYSLFSIIDYQESPRWC
jgi:hypothetical protein